MLLLEKLEELFFIASLTYIEAVLFTLGNVGLAMSTPKYKDLSFENRCIIQNFLNYGYSFSTIAKPIGKACHMVAKRVLKCK